MSATVKQSIELYYTEGTSDKTYHVLLVERENGFTVDTKNGKRDGKLKDGTKTETPVTLAEAQKIYDQLVKRQKAKGYTEDQSGAVFTGADKDFTGIALQLSNEIDHEQALKLAQDDDWMMELKFDGERRGLKVDAQGIVTGINRKGLAVPVPSAIEFDAKRLHNTVGAFVVDGEIMDVIADGTIVGQKLWVFDVLEIGGEDVRSKGAFDRCAMAWGLGQLMFSGKDSPMEVCQAYFSTEAKLKALKAFEEAGLEGVVFKRKDAAYVGGRPASGGNHLKRKFWESATLQAGPVNSDRRSVPVHGYDEQGARVPLGNVTIPESVAIPAPDAIVEIKYLYAYKGGSLFEASYKGLRGDMGVEDCLISQLKYKVEMTDELAKIAA